MPPTEISHVVAATAFVQNGDGLVLLVRSPQRGWELPGGQVQRGEGLIDALRREVMEKAGIMIEIERLAGVYQNLEKSALILAFVAHAAGGSLRTSEECIAVGWYAEPEAARMISCPALRLRFEDLRRKPDGIVYQSFQTTTFATLMARKL